MSTLQDVIDKLEAQGSADQIALFLQSQGVKGRSAVNHCPVARYAQAELGLMVGVLTERAWLCQPIRERVELPEAVRDFIRGFDGDSYPDLKDDGGPLEFVPYTRP